MQHVEHVEHMEHMEHMEHAYVRAEQTEKVLKCLIFIAVMSPHAVCLLPVVARCV